MVAALLPLLVGGLAIVGTLLMLRVASELGSISIFALNLVTGLGLGLAIDYSLFIVSRYREEIARTGPGLEAMRRTMATAGRTVLFSSLTVAGALASLLVFPQRFLYSMGIGGSLVALIAAAIALVVLPAVLTLLGERVNSLAPAFLRRRAERDARPRGRGLLVPPLAAGDAVPGPDRDRQRGPAGRPGDSLLGRSTSPRSTPRCCPRAPSARQVDDVLRADFPPFRDQPARSRCTGPATPRRGGWGTRSRGCRACRGSTAARARRRGLGDRGGLGQAAAQRGEPGPGRAASRPARRLGDRLHAHYLDLQASLADHLPLVLAIVVVVTFVVLFLMTGSVILPLKQVLMNVLGAQRRRSGSWSWSSRTAASRTCSATRSQGGLESTQPLLLFAVAFGLSTDYGVFLLARIKEARDGGYDDRESVAVGLERTGRIVTAAALLFAIAIGAFVTSQIIFIKEVGSGPRSRC